jgi:hypothetical protein
MPQSTSRRRQGRQRYEDMLHWLRLAVRARALAVATVIFVKSRQGRRRYGETATRSVALLGDLLLRRGLLGSSMRLFP